MFPELIWLGKVLNQRKKEKTDQKDKVGRAIKGKVVIANTWKHMHIPFDEYNNFRQDIIDNILPQR